MAVKPRLEGLLQSGGQIEYSSENDRFRRPLVWVRLSNSQTAGEVFAARTPRGAVLSGAAGIVEQLVAVLSELRALISNDGPIDHARCMRLLLQAISSLSEPRRAAELLEEAHQLIPSIELAELLGGERQLGTDEFMGLLDEIAKIVGVDKI